MASIMQQETAVTLLAARSASQSGAGVVGHSTALEKDYFRLTSMPTLDAVRPPAVLKQALRMVQQHWLQVEGLFFQCNYHDLQGFLHADRK